MDLALFLDKVHKTPAEIQFAQVMSLIERHFNYQPTGFDNGGLRSDAGINEGSCKIFSLAQELRLSDSACLACFGDYYRVDVLQHPKGQDHANIRQFLKTGLAEVRFDRFPLTAKT